MKSNVALYQEFVGCHLFREMNSRKGVEATICKYVRNTQHSYTVGAFISF